MDTAEPAKPSPFQELELLCRQNRVRAESFDGSSLGDLHLLNSVSLHPQRYLLFFFPLVNCVSRCLSVIFINLLFAISHQSQSLSFPDFSLPILISLHFVLPASVSLFLFLQIGFFFCQPLLTNSTHMCWYTIFTLSLTYFLCDTHSVHPLLCKCTIFFFFMAE